MQLSSSLTPIEGKKSASKSNRNAFKNGRLNTKLRKSLNNLKKETESPYRKVTITTDLKCPARQSKPFLVCARNYKSLFFHKGIAGGRRPGLRGAGQLGSGYDHGAGADGDGGNMLEDWDIEQAARPHISNST